MTDVRQKALARRHLHEAEIAKIDTFLGMLDELEGEVVPKSIREQRDAPVQRQRTMPTAGVVFESATVIKDYMRAYGEGRKTRELVPVVESAGIEVGGKDKVATLSARISTSQMFELRQGGWYLRRPEEEAADNQSKDESAASLFQSDQEGGEDNAAALA